MNADGSGSGGPNESRKLGKLEQASGIALLFVCPCDGFKALTRRRRPEVLRSSINSRFSSPVSCCFSDTLAKACAIALRLMKKPLLHLARGALENNGGQGGIRTHGTELLHTGFRNRLLQPLGHLSKGLAGRSAPIGGEPNRIPDPVELGYGQPLYRSTHAVAWAAP